MGPLGSTAHQLAMSLNGWQFFNFSGVYIAGGKLAAYRSAAITRQRLLGAVCARRELLQLGPEYSSGERNWAEEDGGGRLPLNWVLFFTGL